jgi:PAS domain S-box-containing protein
MGETEPTGPAPAKLIGAMIDPPPDVVDPLRRRQARLLSALLLAILVGGSVSGLVQLLIVPGFLPTFQVIVGALVALAIAYALARTTHYPAAAWLACLIPGVASYAALLANPTDQTACVFLLIGVLLSSMLLNFKSTLGLAGLNVIGLLALPFMQPAWTPSIVAGKLSFHVLIPALIVLAMKQRDLAERDRRQELSESESKFRSIFNSSVDAIGLSKVGIHVTVNPAYLAMFGYDSVDQLAGTPILDLIAPSERARVAENVRRRYGGEMPPADYETRGRRRDGAEFDMEVHVSTYDRGGEPHTVVILRDITERRRIEEGWRSSEQRYRLLFEANPHPMWVYDLESLAFLTVNDAAISRYGYSREEFAGMTIRDIRPPEDIPRLLDHVGKPHPGIDQAGQWRHRLKDGTIIDVEITSHPFTFDGRAAELVHAGNVTERIRARRELEEHRRRLAFLLAKSPSVIYSARAEGDFGATFVSDNVTRQMGYQPQDFTADPEFWMNHLHPDDVPRVLASLETLLLEGTLAYEYRFLNKSGRYIWMRDEMTLVRDASGQPTEIVGAWIDVTSRKEAEAEREALIRELTEKNSELTRFTYTVSHDLKSPLVTIGGFLNHVAEDAASGRLDRLGPDIDRIQKAVKKMGRLLNELLELSRVGRIMADPESIPFQDLAAQAMESVQGRLDDRGVKVEIQPDLKTVRGDRARLTQVVQNLLDNAAKFMGSQADPHVEIGRMPGGDGLATFFVRDNGMGIAPKHHERVFGLFDKLDTTSDGTGVGLALVKRIIEVHGGRVWVESEEGKGATFFFTLPAGREQPEGGRAS